MLHVPYQTNLPLDQDCPGGRLHLCDICIIELVEEVVGIAVASAGAGRAGMASNCGRHRPKDLSPFPTDRGCAFAHRLEANRRLLMVNGLLLLGRSMSL